MARRDREVGVIKSCVLAAALVAGLALPAQADDKKLTLSATDGAHDRLHVPRRFQHG